MTPERWRALQEVFEAAVAVSAAERPAFVNRTCQGDETLREEVLSLLDHAGRSRDIADVVHGVAAARLWEEQAAALVGRRIGAYRVAWVIGFGGVGVVYGAVRDDEQFSKNVAIKLIRPGMDSAFILARFRAEQKILASLEHPGIARLLDGGTSEDGQPYFVMEYVEGLAITRHCEVHGVPVAGRLRLFRAVCDAVHYAHRNLVVHRDIKPSNILVSKEGVPKLLDFGLAKVLMPAFSPESPTITAAAGRMLTPGYASPEQVQGGTETTATDIYSLGAVLYEMLTGERPHRLKEFTPAGIERAICQAEIDRPSTAVLRGMGAADRVRRQLARQLAGDLDNIVLRAMHKEPERRYGSVEQFSQDIQHYLEGRPVVARADSLAYRAGKFVVRHRLPVAAAALAAMGLFAGGIVAAYQARRAERRFQEVRKLANVFIYDLNLRLQFVPGSIETRRFVVKTGLDYLASLRREAGGDVPLLVDLAKAYNRLGDVQGSARAANLGDPAGAMASYRNAAAILENVQRRLDRQGRLSLARTYINIGFLHANRGQAREAIDAFRKCEPIGEALAAGGTNAEGLEIIGQIYLGIARARRLLVDNQGVQEHAAKALAVYQKLAAIDPASFNYQTFVSSSHVTLGLAIEDGGRRPDALAHYLEAVRIREMLAARDPSSRQARLNLLDTYSTVGDFLESSLNAPPDHERALLYYQKMLALAEALAQQDPGDQKARVVLSFGLQRVGQALGEVSRFDDALDHLRRSAVLASNLLASDPTSYSLRDTMRAGEMEIARLQLARGKALAAREHSQAAVSVAESLLRTPGGTEPAGWALDSYQQHVRIQGRLGDAGGVQNASQRILELIAQTSPKSVSSVSYLVTAPQALAAAGEAYASLARRPQAASARLTQLTDACSWFRKSLDRWNEIQAAGFTGGRFETGPIEVKKQLSRCEAEAGRLRASNQ